jgi:hypothetical protein
MLLLLFPINCIGCDATDQKIIRFAQKIGISNDIDKACLILNKVITQVELTQDGISRIASSEVNYDYKTRPGGYIEKVVSAFFENNWSIVQITRLTTKNPIDMYIKDYLGYIAEYTTKYSGEVKLVFIKDYTKILDVTNSGDYQEFKINSAQMFYACKTVDGKQCYQDVTVKVFDAILINRDTYPDIKIRKISAIDTMTYNEFSNRSGTYIDF